MRYQIEHTLRFDYSEPVFLEPHVFNLCPRSDGAQRLITFSLKIDPPPAGVNSLLDLEGNTATRAWFMDSHAGLTVTARSVVETTRENAFDFLPEPSFSTLPKPYAKTLEPLLKPYLARTPLAAVKKFVAPVLKESRKNPLDFLFKLTGKFHAEFKKLRRESGAPWSPGKTLSMGVGSCRDLSVLFAVCCRSQGLAARFVSGYYEADPSIVEKDLHAWVEVYIPGAGWRGYDPLNGLVTAENHIALAASVDPSSAAPLTGTFRGSGANGKMTYAVRLTREAMQTHGADAIN